MEQSINQSINRSIDGTINQSINRAINQSSDQSINQSFEAAFYTERFSRRFWWICVCKNIFFNVFLDVPAEIFLKIWTKESIFYKKILKIKNIFGQNFTKSNEAASFRIFFKKIFEKNSSVILVKISWNEEIFWTCGWKNNFFVWKIFRNSTGPSGLTNSHGNRFFQFHQLVEIASGDLRVRRHLLPFNPFRQRYPTSFVVREIFAVLEDGHSGPAFQGNVLQTVKNRPLKKLTTIMSWSHIKSCFTPDASLEFVS